VQERVQQEIKELNKDLAEHERIKRIRLVEEEWTAESGELSPTAKLKRRKLYETYDHLLSEIYSVGKGTTDFSE
jgi:long-chain acyl-CoA synthetase